MDNFSDYAEKQNEGIQSEIDEAAQETQNREQDNSGTVLDRFAGKSAEQISASYEELERKFSQQGNDMGVLRNTVDSFIALQSQEEAQTETQEVTTVTSDDLYEDPDAAIRKAIKQETQGTSDRIAELESALASERYNASLTSLDAKHTGWREVASSPEFAEWVQSSPYRIRMAQAAQAQDASAADDLMGLWFELHGNTKERQNFANSQNLQNASLESSGAAYDAPEETFSRTDLMEKRVAARRGDKNAAAFLNKNREAIVIAYEEGHITD